MSRRGQFDCVCEHAGMYGVLMFATYLYVNPWGGRVAAAMAMRVRALSLGLVWLLAEEFISALMSPKKP